MNSLVTKNLVYNHDRTGIAAVPFPEEDANDVAPPESAWAAPCEGTRDDKVPAPGVTIPDVVLWQPTGNIVTDNVVTDSGLADIASATIALGDNPLTTDQLGNCFANNEAASSAPTDLEALAPCEGAGSDGDWNANTLDLGALIAKQPPKPAKDSYKKTPVPKDGENMPGALTEKPKKFTAPTKPDIDAITVPEKP